MPVKIDFVNILRNSFVTVSVFKTNSLAAAIAYELKSNLITFF